MRIYVYLTIACSLAAVPSPAERLRFNAPQAYAAAGPTAAATADLNGDGNADVVTVNWLQGEIGVLLGDGQGGFGRIKIYKGSQATGVVIGDFNGDGKPDLAVSGGDNVTLLLGVGDGTFTNVGSTAVGFNAFDMIAADFNGDGHLDLALPAPTGVQILSGNGDGTFQPAVTYALGGVARTLTLADFNHDGKLDLAAGGINKSQVSVLLGKGDGTFTVLPPFNVGQNDNYICSGDFNGDGFADLAVSDVANQVIFVLLGKGDGTFQQTAQYAYSAEGRGGEANFLATADLAGDGKLDLLVTDAVLGNAAILMGNGDGTFQKYHNLAAGFGPHFILTVDLNNDGKIDLVIANQASSDVEVLLGVGGGKFGPQAVMYESGNSEGGFVVGDFNHDGHPDVAVAGQNIGVLISNGHGFQKPATYQLPNSVPWAESLAMADFNGDGIMDLVACFGFPPTMPGTAAVLLGKADGTFQAAVTTPAGVEPSSLMAGDFNGDGLADIVVSDAAESTISLYPGKGDGTFGAPTTIMNTVMNTESSVAGGDFNGDGNLDLAILGVNGLYILLGDGTGGFKAAWTGDISGFQLAVGDVNHDGKPDLAVLASHTVVVLLGNGDGTFSKAGQYSTTQSSSVTIADVNGDGNADVLVGTDVKTVFIFLGNGEGKFKAGLEWSIPGQVSAVGVGDFSWNGKADLAVAIQQGTLALLTNLTK